MTSPSRPALCATLDYLRDLSRDRIGPHEARTLLQGLRSRYPETRIDLLSEEEACDRSVHYDALLHCAGEGTVSLSFCPEQTLPWPLRGVQRWSEMNLVRVNATILKVDQAVAMLDFMWDDAAMLKRLVHACLIREALDQDPVTPTDEELQRALNAFRRVHRLYKAEDMYHWMEQRCLTQEKLECLVTELAEVAALRNRVTAGRVEEYFARHHADFDTVSLAQFAIADQATAQRIGEQVRNGELDFYTAAEQCFLAAGPTEYPCLTTVRRSQISLGLSIAFDSAPGTILGPQRSNEKYLLARVLSHSAAPLNEPTRAAIQELLFEEWLEERRKNSSIEWYWGPANC